MPLGVLQTISDCGTQDHVVFFSVTGVAGLKTENAGRQMGIYRGVIMLVQEHYLEFVDVLKLHTGTLGRAILMNPL